ncbi:MAG: hypothetical protein HQ523_15740 [Lentisphaerae bacterium]|nr:hypothetical protein [Lentisphaerota bacterium]
MAFDSRLIVTANRRSEEEQEEILFRMLANRGYVNYGNLYDSSHIMPDWVTRLHKLYNQALPHMRGCRRLLPNNAGVRWENRAGNLIWTYSDWHPDTDATFVRLDGEKEMPWTQPVLESGNVYRSLT